MIYTTLYSFITAAEEHIGRGETNEAHELIQQCKNWNKGGLSKTESKSLQLQIEHLEKTIGVQKVSEWTTLTPSLTPLRGEKFTERWKISHLFFVSMAAASLYYFPIPSLCVLGAGVVYKLFSQYVQSNKPFVPIQRVELQKARQYDLKGAIPAACTFHALEAGMTISSQFEEFADLISQNYSKKLSLKQQQILGRGLTLYAKGLAKNREFIQGADIDQIAKLKQQILPQGMNIQEKQTVVVNGPEEVKEKVKPILDYLFDRQGNPSRIVIMKNGNDESFSLIGKGEKVIIFDSHQNEIVLTQGREAISSQLSAKLAEYVEGMNTFEYAFVNTTR